MNTDKKNQKLIVIFATNKILKIIFQEKSIKTTAERTINAINV